MVKFDVEIELPKSKKKLGFYRTPLTVGELMGLQKTFTQNDDGASFNTPMDVVKQRGYLDNLKLSVSKGIFEALPAADFLYLMGNEDFKAIADYYLSDLVSELNEKKAESLISEESAS